jgi:hemolysin III
MAAMLKQSVSPWPHAIGFFLALLGLGYLVAHFHRDAASLAAMTIYGCGLVVTFGASALYHWLGGEGPRRNAVLRRVDHASIYVMIACSYTPVLYFGLAGAWRSATIASVWLLTAVGVASTIWFFGAPRALSTTFYVALGWVAIVPAAKLIAMLSHEAIALIVTGGILYSGRLGAPSRFAPVRAGRLEAAKGARVGGYTSRPPSPSLARCASGRGTRLECGRKYGSPL